MAGARAEIDCADWLPVLSPHLPECLVDASSLERLGDLWSRFPRDALVALEVRLGEGARQVDCSLRLASPDQARAVHRRLLDEDPGDLFGRWGQDPRLAYPEPVSALWLEFDLDGGFGASRQPLLCARLERQPSPEWLVEILFPALSGRPLGLRQAEIVRRAVLALPSGGEVLYGFSLQPRLDSAVRIELYGLQPAGMVRYLEDLASPGVAAQVARLAPLIREADRYHLSLDIADELLPRIGVECGWRRLPYRDERWRRFLDRLVTAGLATVDKREAVLAWPGYDTLWSAPWSWPTAARGRGGYLVRSLSHFKLVSLPDGDEPEAKAYLLFQHLDRRRQDGPTEEAWRPSSPATA